MQLRLLVPVFSQRSLLLVSCIALTSCQSHKPNSGPSIEFTHIPRPWDAPITEDPKASIKAMPGFSLAACE